MGFGAAVHLSAIIDPVEVFIKQCPGLENRGQCARSVSPALLAAGERGKITPQIIFDSTVFHGATENSELPTLMNLLVLGEVCFKTRSLCFSSTTALPSPSCSLNSNTIYFPRLPNLPGYMSAAFRPSVVLLDSTGIHFSYRDLHARGNRMLVQSKCTYR